MKERPILFTPENAGKIFKGTKTQTRRALKPPPPAEALRPEATTCGAVESFHFLTDKPLYRGGPCCWHVNCPFGTVGDRLWIRESHCILRGSEGDDDIVCYRADKSIRAVHCREENGKLVEWVNSEPDQENCADDYRDPANDKWKSAMFMPRYACRTVVEITDIRVQRLQDISEEDIRAEGVELPQPYIGVGWDGLPIESENIDKDPWWFWQQLWDSINLKTHPWSSNPWVFAITFQKLDK